MNTTSVRPNMFKHMLVNVKIVSPKGETVCSYNTASVVRPVVVEQ
jgi:hypothetical protein